MLSLPKFLINLSDTAARKTQGGEPIKIELLRFERAKEGGWKSYLALGDVLLTMNVPSDPLGHGDAVFLCEALATALRGAPPDQMALAGFSRADPKFVTPPLKQPTLGLPEPNQERRPVPPAVPPAPTGRGAPALIFGAAGAIELKPPRGRKPKPGWCRFRVVGADPKTEIVLESDGLLAKWEMSGEPNDTYTGEEFLGPWSPGETKSTAECTRPVYAGVLNSTNHALWLCDGSRYAPGKGLWVHVEALGKNPKSIGGAVQKPMAPPMNLPPKPIGCCVCGRPMKPNLPNNPEPVKCLECWEGGAGPEVSDAEVGELDEDHPDTDPPPEGTEHPPESEPPPFEPDTTVDTPAARPTVATEPFEPCFSCSFHGTFTDGSADACMHKAHYPERFIRPCADRLPR
jgi:hypothetical protein